MIGGTPLWFINSSTDLHLESDHWPHLFDAKHSLLPVLLKGRNIDLGKNSHTP